MKSKTLFLHIGAGKTGTTAIQEFCLLNLRELSKRGYLFPKLGLYGESHNLLGHAWGVGWMPPQMIEELVPSDIWHKARQLFSKTKGHMIISSETLTWVFDQKPESMREIRSLFAGYQVQIIFYVRRQDLHAQSVYNQRVKTGHSDERFNVDKLSEFYDYYAFLCSIAEVFGKENVIVRPYEKQQFRDGNIYSDFLFTLGVNWSGDFAIPQKDPNPRLGQDALDFLRIANSVDRPWERKLQFNQLVSKLSLFQEDAIGAANSGLSVEENRAILERFQSSNQRVAREFLGREDGVLFYGSAYVTKPQTSEGKYSGLQDGRAVLAAVNLWELMHEKDVELRKELAESELEIKRQKIELENLYASTSWKVTTPLRWLGKIMCRRGISL